MRVNCTAAGPVTSTFLAPGLILSILLILSEEINPDLLAFIRGKMPAAAAVAYLVNLVNPV